jgi:hypothetical protein
VQTSVSSKVAHSAGNDISENRQIIIIIITKQVNENIAINPEYSDEWQSQLSENG